MGVFILLFGCRNLAPTIPLMTTFCTACSKVERMWAIATVATIPYVVSRRAIR